MKVVKIHCALTNMKSTHSKVQSQKSFPLSSNDILEFQVAYTPRILGPEGSLLLLLTHGPLVIC